MAEPLVSVIIPAHNAEPWLSDAIASVIDQDYKNIEVLVCDDGSRDGTARVMNGWCPHKQVRLFLSNENRGHAHTRNLLTSKAQGEIIIHQDADDLSKPGRIAAQVRHLLDNGLVFNCTGLECSDGRVWTHWAQNAVEGLRTMATGGKAFAGNSCAYLRRVWDEGIRNDERWPWGSDLLFEAQIMARYFPSLAAMPEPLVWYRRHDAQATRRIERGQIELTPEYLRTRAEAIRDAIRPLCERVLGRPPQIRV